MDVLDITMESKLYRHTCECRYPVAFDLYYYKHTGFRHAPECLFKDSGGLKKSIVQSNFIKISFFATLYPDGERSIFYEQEIVRPSGMTLLSLGRPVLDIITTRLFASDTFAQKRMLVFKPQAMPDG